MVIQSISPMTVSMQFGGQIRKDLGVQAFMIRVSASLSQFVYQAREGQDGEILGPGNSKKVWTKAYGPVPVWHSFLVHECGTAGPSCARLNLIGDIFVTCR